MVHGRELLRWFAALFFSISSGCLSRDGTVVEKPEVTGGKLPVEKSGRSKVYVIKTSDRKEGVKELLNRSELNGLSGKRIAIKANYNSADPFPASTHIDTLSAMIGELKGRGNSVIMAERSGMGETREVLEEMGVMELSGKQGFDVVILDELEAQGWIREEEEGSRWRRGFLFPKLFRDADAIVQTCCLKTHRFGGHFTMSLKNSVGMVAARDPEDDYNYMGELHSSRFQRQMIADINAAYEPALVIMDGIQGFSKGGPESGTLIEPGVMIGGKDRVAVDAVGVSVLRLFGTTAEVGKGRVFEQEQIARAAELGLGASGAPEVVVVPVNPEAEDICSGIEQKLAEQF